MHGAFQAKLVKCNEEVLVPEALGVHKALGHQDCLQRVSQGPSAWP